MSEANVKSLLEEHLDPGGIHPLITENRSTGNGYHVSLREYESGDVELSAIKLGPEDSLKRGGGAKREYDDKQDMEQVVLSKSQSRARVTVRRRCYAMQVDRLLTLTFRENVGDINEAWDVFKYFAKLMRWRFGDRFSYVAVPEYQKRGALHFHLAIRGYYPVNTVRKLWLRASGKRGGNIDITSPKKFEKGSWNPRRIAQYLSKYITKTDSVEFNKKRYSSSKNIVVPEPIRGWLPLTDLAHYIFDQCIELRTRKTIACAWESEGYFGVIYKST